MRNTEIIIYTEDYEALNDLKEWIENDFAAFSIYKGDTIALGEECTGIKVVFECIKKNWTRLVTILKNWMYNYNKDIELTLENGNKKINLKCPAKRVNEENMDQIFLSFKDFFEDE